MLTKREAGFSILELLLVLAIINIMLLISARAALTSIDHYRFQVWYQQFDLDVLYLQKRAMLNLPASSLQFIISQNRYGLWESPVNPPLFIREIPDNWQVSMRSLGNPLSFTSSGTVRRPGSMHIDTGKNQYHIYFPFGKGRQYYVKE
ncbi:competence protein ComGD [Amphibacillus marinus]|uniref:Competence protein ComGD n=1 Tax=Amphibacillus marinus TaxID=872970 RepID=A0A1H8HDV2_9BACI|nr:type II secretion system protein [Amphibacillus marinus]SEN54462.1 competence protein ComGD [Amphibacillus marinus]